MPLTREQILQADDRKTVVVEVPEWGGSVIVSSMDGITRDKFEASLVLGDGKVNRKINLENMRARLVALCTVDEDGNRLFTDDDVTILGKKNAKALDKVADVCQELNGLTDKKLEEAKGN